MIQQSLALLLYQHLDATEPTRSTDDYIHVSDLYDLCGRQYVLARREGVKITRKVPPALRMKFEMGRALELIVQGWFREMGIFDEAQPRLVNEDLRIVGYPDGRMKNGLLGEIKSQNPALFRLSARKPLTHHEFQVQAYLFLDANHKSGLLFSTTWDNIKMPFREHMVRFNIAVGEAIKNTVGIIREAEVSGGLPPRTCESEFTKRALLCPLRSQCFRLPSAGTMPTIGESLK